MGYSNYVNVGAYALFTFKEEKLEIDVAGCIDSKCKEFEKTHLNNDLSVPKYCSSCGNKIGTYTKFSTQLPDPFDFDEEYDDKLMYFRVSDDKWLGMINNKLPHIAVNIADESERELAIPNKTTAIAAFSKRYADILEHAGACGAMTMIKFGIVNYYL